MCNFRAYVVKIFNELFGGRRGSGASVNNEISSSVNETNEVIRGRRVVGEAYLAAIIIGIVRLISSLLLAQLLTR